MGIPLEHDAKFTTSIREECQKNMKKQFLHQDEDH